jgi:ADP-ribosylglycohydrolase
VEDLLTLVRDEVEQLAQEGVERLDADHLLTPIVALSGPERSEALEGLYADLAGRAPGPGFPYREPSDLAGITAARPARPAPLSSPPRAELQDRILGAWLGRCAGCTLGKPVEGWRYATIRSYLESAAAWPLQDYIPPDGKLPEGGRIGLDEAAGVRWGPGQAASLRGHVDGMARDDDIDYTILGLHVLERFGGDFSTADVGRTWLETLPYGQTYTAERVAYRNLVNGLEPPATATCRNPYREWIGAQIRGDIWGYVNPGDPDRAATMAYADAALSHTKNGVYGEQFAAGMIAAALATDDVEQIVDWGLAVIPARCRLAEGIAEVRAWHRVEPAWEGCRARIEERYGTYNWVHTIPNALVVVMALLYGRRRFEETVCIAVAAGWDADCNGATAGSILGATLGAAQLPSKWVAPLHDRLRSSVVGFDGAAISDLALRTVGMVS